MIKLTTALLQMYNSYSGDDFWKKYTKTLNNFDSKGMEGVPRDIYAVATELIGKKYVTDWFNKEIPALGFMTPIDVIDKFDEGEIIIRSLLMRMH